MNYYLADTHFGDTNCLHFDNRPFLTIEEMDNTIIQRWNEVVSNADTVYILGDFSWYKEQKTIEILKSLSGNKILIRDNHDKFESTAFKSQFIKIVDYLEVEDNGKHIVLCHYPLPYYKNHFYGRYLFYGHVHTSFEYNMVKHDIMLMNDLYNRPCQMFNVGVMIPYMNYAPKTANEIIENNISIS